MGKSKKQAEIDRLSDPFMTLRAIRNILASSTKGAEKLAQIESVMIIFSTAIEIRKSNGKNIYIGRA